MAIIKNLPDAEDRALYADHLSISNWRSWLKCGARQYEIDCGTWSEPYRDPAKDPLAIGTFAHTALLQPELLAEYNDKAGYYKKSGKSAGELYEPFQQALAIAAKILRAEGSAPILAGDKEVTVTGEIAGIKWCGRIDILDIANRRFWDLKTTASFSDHWTTIDGRNCKVAWYADYWPQIALYGELLNQSLPGDTPWIGGLLAGTKQDPPAIGAWEMDDPGKLALAISHIQETQRDILDWKNKVEGKYPTACMDMDNCAYCREHSSLILRKAV